MHRMHVSSFSHGGGPHTHEKKIKQILGMAKTTDPWVPDATLMGRVLLDA